MSEKRGHRSNTQERILAYIEDTIRERGYAPSVREIGEAVGLRSTSTVHGHLTRLEKKGLLRRDALKPRAMGLMSSAPEDIPSTCQVPVVGQVAAGMPILAEENVEELLTLPKSFVGEGDHFILRVKGDSMKPRYLDGALVFIRCQPDVRDGQIAAVVVGGEATLKRVYHVPGGVQLISENPEYSPMLYTEDDVNDIHLIGLAVGFMRWETQR